MRLKRVLASALLGLCGLFAGCAEATALPEANYVVLAGAKPHGGNPTALIEGTDGLIYGTLKHGGNRGEGAVFSVRKDGSGFTLLCSFQGYSRKRDGSWPVGLIEGKDGSLYGATETGGVPDGFIRGTGAGTIFSIAKDGSGYSVLHRFEAKADGLDPASGVVQGRDGALYGTTLSGGRFDGGTIFRLSTDGKAYAVLHHFAGGDADGYSPKGSLLSGSDGFLYGTTDGGGNSGPRNGTIFRIGTDGTGFRLLHSFPTRRKDGRMPRTPLVEGADGMLYGTTSAGGEDDGGTVFKIKKDGTGYAVLHAFHPSNGSKPDTNGRIEGTFNGMPTKFSAEGNGSGPQCVVLGKDGLLYGTSEYGGRNGSGTLFRLKTSGHGFAAIHHFDADDSDAKNGGILLAGNNGSLYGLGNTSASGEFAPMFKVQVQVDDQIKDSAPAVSRK